MTNLISDQEKAYLTQVIAEIFVQYNAQVDKKDVEFFCTNFVEQRDTETDSSIIIGDVNRGLNTIDSLESYHRDLIDAQNKGKSKLNWLQATIKTITNINDVRKIGEIVQSIQTELAKSNNQHLSSLLAEDVEVFPEMPEREFTGINQQIAVQELLGEVQNNSLLTAIFCGQQIESVVNLFNTNDENVSEVAKNCFEGELGNNSELVAKKLVTCGVIVANNEFPIEALDGMDAPAIAVAVDIGVTIAKVGYKLAQSKMQLTKSMEYIFDRSVAAIGVVTHAVVRSQGQLMGTQVGAIIGSALGPVGTIVGAIGGAVVGRLAGSKIAQEINTGITKIGQLAKERVLKVVETRKEVGKEVTKAAKKVKEFLGNLFR